jgi:hypothetical protein
MMSESVRFVTVPVADVSTIYLEPFDLQLLLRTDAPHHLANTDGCEGSFFYTPEGDFETFAAACREFGLSERFIFIMRAAHERNIPYVRFDADGATVEGCEPCDQEVRDGR